MTTWRIVIVAVGGQGNLLVTKILGEAAARSDLPVQISEVHGMAQRGGVVETDVLIGEAMSSTVSDGEADILLAFEPLEALRAIRKCSEDSRIITSTAPVVPFTVTVGNGTYPDVETMVRSLKGKAGHVVALDAAGLAKSAGNPLAVNMVMLGALARTGDLPFSNELFENIILGMSKEPFKDSNITAFRLGYETAGNLQ